MLFSSSIQVLNAMPDHDGFEIIELRYDDQQGQVELEVKAKSIDQLDKYKQALGKSGLTAKISSANDGGSGVEGRMQINKAQ
jgi:type II secretory pathway component PulL